MATHFQRETLDREEKDPGYGGIPPFDLRPTGGGGGGGDDDSQGKRRPRTLLERVRLALFLFIGLDLSTLVLTFALQLGHRAFLDSTSAAGAASNAGLHTTHLPALLWINVGILLASCVAMEIARRHIFDESDVFEEWLCLGKPALRHALPWMGVAALLGSAFLFCQSLAVHQISAQSSLFAHLFSPLNSFFSLIAGIQALHLSVGVLVLLLSFFVLGRLRRVELRQVIIDATAWYWQAIAASWIMLLIVASLA